MTRSLYEIVELTRDCDLGERGERAVVAKLATLANLMTLVFPNREVGQTRWVHTGADYRFLKGA